MTLLCLKAWLVIIYVNFVAAQGAVCPSCTSKYDYNSCTQTQPCEADWNYCELIVKPDDGYSLEYVCKQALECITYSTAECHPGINETCVYCCEEPVTCQLQRDDLYNYVFPESGLVVTSSTSEYPASPTRPSSATTQSTDGVQASLPTAITTTTAPTTDDGAVVECPVCSDAYDHTTCSGVQKCSGIDAVCQLSVYTADLLRLEYQCQHYEVCTDREADGCHPQVDDTCVYCCADPVTCQLQRDDLFTYELPSLGFTTSPSAANETTTATTAQPSVATLPPTTTPTTETTPQTTSATTLPPPTTSTVSGIYCLQCGNFAEHTPCSLVEQILAKPEACPDSLPYCFTSFTQNGTDVLVYKGCATENFCSLEYELSSAKSECTNPDLTSPRHASCGYCCNHDICNAPLKPEDSSLVVFP